ncbi:MAG: asparagine synthase (glutamine-hydrolyzing), partial [Gemmatimonadaceae bacterium]
HDTKRKRLLLARDHLGIKPLFYRVEGETLFFASEIKALFAGTSRPPRARRESIQEYLVFRYIAGGNTFYEDVQRLPAGHVAIWDRGQLELHRYWSPPSNELPAVELEPAVDRLEGLLAHAVRSQLMSEVPLGAFCSGGVDSGLVSAFAADASAHRLATFAVGFRDPAWDERSLAEDTARRIGASHHVVIAEPEEFCALLPRLLWYHDEPLNHPNTIPLYQLSRFARQFVTVVLTGEGADELFCGYPRYHIARWRAAANGLPRAIRRPLAGVLARGPGHRSAKLGDSFGRELEDALIFNSAYVAPEIVARLTGNPVDGALAERRALLATAQSDSGAVATLSLYELLTYLGCALDRMDRMSMACSLEGRVPFLDVPLVEWAVQLAGPLKLSGKQNKRVVKALAQRRLNPAIARGAKSGFGVPLGDWFRSPVLAPLLERLRDPGHPAANLFDQREVRRLTDAHVAGAVDHGEALWLLANVYVWAEINADGVASQPPNPMGAPALATQ